MYHSDPHDINNISSEQVYIESLLLGCCTGDAMASLINHAHDNMFLASNKMLWHMDRVRDWSLGKKIAPLHIDLGISQGCNIACRYCFGATQGNLFKNGIDKYVSRGPLLQFMQDCGDIGVRSIAIIGEAEPLLNPAVYEAIIVGKEAGVDIALGTNGVLWKDCTMSRHALSSLTWIRFNISAGSIDGYKKIHRSNEFDRVVSNIQLIVNLKQQLHLSLTIGLQLVLTEDTIKEVIPLAKLGKKLGVDYLVIKQCSDYSDNKIGYYDKQKQYLTEQYNEILSRAEKISTGSYHVIVKWPQLHNQGQRCYSNCLGAPFLLHVAGDGRIYSCASFYEGAKRDDFLLGNFTKERFKELYQSNHYWNIIEKVKEIDVHTECYANCRTNSINEFLDTFSKPPKHINFV